MIYFWESWERLCEENIPQRGQRGATRTSLRKLALKQRRRVEAAAYKVSKGGKKSASVDTYPLK